MSAHHSFAVQNTCPARDKRRYLGSIGDCHLYAHDTIEAVSRQWQTLQAGTPHSPFQQLFWARSIAAGTGMVSGQTDRKKSRHVFVVGFVGEKPVLIVPLDIQTGPLGARLTWLGEKVSDYNGPVIDRDFGAGIPPGFLGEVLSLLQAANSEIQAAHLIRNPVGGVRIVCGNSGGTKLLSAEFMSHALTLNKDWKGLYAQLRSAKSRQRLRSKYCALKRAGNLSFRRVRGRSSRQDATRRILTWKSAQLDKMGARNRFGRHDGPAALWLTIENAMRSDDRSLEVFGLYQDNRLIAGMLAFVTGDTFYYYVSSFSPSVSQKYSTGTLLFVKTMELAARANLKTYDFLIGDEAYKFDWCDTRIALQHVTHAFTWRGWLICTAIAIRLSVKKFIIRHGEIRKAAQTVQKQITLLRPLRFREAFKQTPPADLDKMKAKEFS